MKKLLLLMLMPCAIVTMEQSSSDQKKVISESERRDALKDRLKSFLRIAEKDLGVDPQWLAFNNEMDVGAQTDERGLIVINTQIIPDEDEIKYHICHELGHVKDGTINKKFLAMSAYYPSCIMLPSLLLYGIQRLAPMNRNLLNSSYAGLAVSGIFASLFFHTTVNLIIDRHLEKRADLIGLSCLLNMQNYTPICKTLISLEQSKLLGVKHASDHPAPADIYDYLTNFLRKNKIQVQSEAQQEADKTLNGTMTLLKDGQTLSHFNWRWRPKC